MEQSFRQAIRISDGDINIFYGSTLALALIVITFVSIVFPIFKEYMMKKKAEKLNNAA